MIVGVHFCQISAIETHIATSFQVWFTFLWIIPGTLGWLPNLTCMYKGCCQRISIWMNQIFGSFLCTCQVLLNPLDVVPHVVYLSDTSYQTPIFSQMFWFTTHNAIILINHFPHHVDELFILLVSVHLTWLSELLDSPTIILICCLQT